MIPLQNLFRRTEMKTLTKTSEQNRTATKPATEPQKLDRPTVDELLSEIRADAGRDALKYVLRSDTSHDGE